MCTFAKYPLAARIRARGYVRHKLLLLVAPVRIISSLQITVDGSNLLQMALTSSSSSKSASLQQIHRNPFFSFHEENYIFPYIIIRNCIVEMV